MNVDAKATLILVDEDPHYRYHAEVYTVDGELEPHHVFFTRHHRAGGQQTFYRATVDESRVAHVHRMRVVGDVTLEAEKAIAFSHILRSLWKGITIDRKES